MSLRTRIVVLLVVVVAIFVVTDIAVQRLVAEWRFADLEQTLALGELDRAKSSLQSEVEEVEFACRNLRSWTLSSTGSFTPGPDSADMEETSNPLAEYGLDLVYLCEERGRVLWRRIEDPRTRRGITIRDFPTEALSPMHPLVEGVSVSGLMTTERGPLVVSALPVPRGSMPELGRLRLMVGRFLDSDRIAGLSAANRLPLRLLTIESLDDEQRSVADDVCLTGEPAVEVGPDDVLLLRDVVEDVRGLPALMVEVEVPRDLLAHGFRMARETALSGAAIAFLMLLIVMIVIERTVIRPVKKVTDHAVALQTSGDTSSRLNLERGDEIGVLARELDRMVDELERGRKEKVEMARLAGISELATGILHNVGNVLNSVNVSSDIVLRNLQKMPVSDLDRALEALEAHREDLNAYVTTDPRGQHLFTLLTALRELVAKQRNIALSELELVLSGIEHINELVHTQQTYAGRSATLEWTSLADQVEDALHICRQTRDEVADVDVEREFEPLDRVQIDRHKTLQILVNLILNACESLNKAEVTTKRLILRLKSGGEGSLRIEVQDNGLGIPADDLLRVFLPGFTTDGRSMGLGLHMAATSAMEMGGSLAAFSDGPGQGATFVLTLPAERRTGNAAA